MRRSIGLDGECAFMVESLVTNGIDVKHHRRRRTIDQSTNVGVCTWKRRSLASKTPVRLGQTINNVPVMMERLSTHLAYLPHVFLCERRRFAAEKSRVYVPRRKWIFVVGFATTTVMYLFQCLSNVKHASSKDSLSLCFRKVLAEKSASAIHVARKKKPLHVWHGIFLKVHAIIRRRQRHRRRILFNLGRTRRRVLGHGVRSNRCCRGRKRAAKVKATPRK